MSTHQKQDRRTALASRGHSPANVGNILHRPLLERRWQLAKRELLRDRQIVFPLG
jgi:hypothetical protein